MPAKETIPRQADRTYVIRQEGASAEAASKISFITPELKNHRTDGQRTGPVFIHMPDSTHKGETVFPMTRRAREASHHVTQRPTNDLKLSDARLREVESIEVYANQRGKSAITLDDFPLVVTDYASERKTDYLSGSSKVKRLRRSSFLPFESGYKREQGAQREEEITEQINPGEHKQKLKQRDNPDVVKLLIAVLDRGDDIEALNKPGDGETDSLMDRFNNLAYRTIQEEYDLDSPREARKFFAERIREANQILRRTANKKIPSKRNAIGLINETSLISSPGELAFYALSARVTDRLQYEALRTLNIAELLAKSDQHADAIQEVLAKFQGVIDKGLFNHGQKIGETKQTTLYAIFDKETGEPLWNSTNDSPLDPEDLEQYKKIGILKRFQWIVRHVDGVGDILTNPRTKGKVSIFDKMIRDAESREKLVGDNHIEPSGITDLGGIKHVLLNEDALHGDKINAMINAHIDLAKAKFDNVKINIHDATRKEVGQAESHSFRRIDVIITEKGQDYKIEMIFEPLKSYLRNEYRVGEVDPKTGIHDGPAHPLYTDRRSESAARRTFPGDQYGEIKWSSVTQKETQRTVSRLRAEDRIKWKKLPDDYIQKAA